jgi:NitT/TauT family transport system permease protein
MPHFAAARRKRSGKPWRREAKNDVSDLSLVPANAGIQLRTRRKGLDPRFRGDERNIAQSLEFQMKQHSAARDHRDRVLRIVLPVVVLTFGLAIWEAAVRIADIPPYVLPAPSLIAQTLITDWSLLWQSLLVTLSTTVEGFLLAAAGGVGLAVLFNQSRLVEYSLYPYAVILQVTPIVAVAPLLLIYLPQPLAVLACAWIVAFFPVLANTTLGLNSIDRNLADLFALYGASRGQVLWRLKLPAALPYILGGLRIAGGLSLIGAVVAEIAAGSAGAGSGLAYRIAESGYRLNIPRMFAALLLLSAAGIVIFYLLALINYLALRRWHESALERER